MSIISRPPDEYYTDQNGVHPYWADIVASNLLSYQKDEVTRSFTTTYIDGWVPAAFNVPSKTIVKVDFAIPMRNDSTGWGGCYTEVFYRINAGTWISLGTSGYDGNVMQNSSASIATYTNNFILDFSANQSAISLQIKFMHKSYDGAATINGSHDITPTNSYAWSHIIAYSLSGVTGAQGPTGKDGTITANSIDGNFLVTGNLTVTGKMTVPIGFTYFQLPGKALPSDMFIGTWSNISATFAGAFFRAEGGNASTFAAGLQASQNLSHGHTSGNDNTEHTHSGTTGWQDRSGTHIHVAPTAGGGTTGAFENASGRDQTANTDAASTDHLHTITTGGRLAYHQHTINADGGTEARPINYTIRIWERTA